MKFKIAVLAFVACCSTAALANQADAVKATAAERCRMLADYAQDVAEMRDLGFLLSDIKEINAERYRNNILDAHDMAAEMTYQHGDLSPAKVREGLLAGCMTAVNQEAARRAQ